VLLPLLQPKHMLQQLVRLLPQLLLLLLLLGLWVANVLPRVRAKGMKPAARGSGIGGAAMASGNDGQTCWWCCAVVMMQDDVHEKKLTGVPAACPELLHTGTLRRWQERKFFG
jgi:hypothetical protein